MSRDNFYTTYKLKHLFGPVPSRRLGRSLGIDLVPFKTCSYNCIYCESGNTTAHITTRKTFVSTETIVTELSEFFKSDPNLDCLTFSGSGEPTLASNIGEIISHLKAHYPQKVVVLTNASLMYDPQVRADLKLADIVIPSLDAATEPAFRKIDRPHASLSVEAIIQGLIEFRKEFTNSLQIEIFIAPGINDNKEEVMALKNACQQIQPDLIQLNALDRPGIVNWITQASRESLEQIAEWLKPLPVEIVSKVKPTDLKKTTNILSDTDIQSKIKDILKRRPCTQTDLTSMLEEQEEPIQKNLATLVQNGSLVTQTKPRGLFYLLKNP